MDIKKLNPWNWFKHEEGSEGHRLPVRRESDTPLSSFGSPLLSLHQEIDRMFDNVFRSIGFPAAGFGSAGSRFENNLLKPNIDIEATDKEYRITAELPGVDEKDISVELSHDGTLTLRGEKKQEREDKGRDFYRVERSYGAFQRVLALPEDASHDGINATFKNGVLVISAPRKALPKAEEVRQINVSSDEETPRRVLQ
jgi:HSP20 family protein